MRSIKCIALATLALLAGGRAKLANPESGKLNLRPRLARQARGQH